MVGSSPPASRAGIVIKAEAATFPSKTRKYAQSQTPLRTLSYFILLPPPLQFERDNREKSNRDIAELTWENGHLAMHEFGGIFPPATAKGPTWDTLESVVHQGTLINKEGGPINLPQHQQQHAYRNTKKNGGSVVASSGGRWGNEMNGLVKKRTRSESDQHCQVKWYNEEDWADMSVCASANAAICRETTDKTMCTWASHDSSRSTRTKTTDEDSGCQGFSENLEGRTTKSETERSHSARKGRAAAVHNQSERRRRDRINQKMKALQKLVPNASKTDKASMLDEVIDYLKQLQAQVQLMSARSMSQHMMMPLGMQQQLQMSILARAGMGMGLGMGMGMLNMGNVANHTPPGPPPHQLGSFVTPSMFGVGPSSAPPQQPKPDPGANSLVPLHDQYNAFLTQSMNMDMYNRMAALYGQQMNRSTKTSSHMQKNPMHDV
ncbi:hypothetical protein V2J09_019539 [Rumex salicifolius]